MKHVILPFVLALSIAPAATAAESVFGSSKARECYLQTEYGVAPASTAQLCSEALREVGLSKTDEAKTLVNRGINYNRAGRYDDALTDFDSAQEIIADLAEAYLGRGNTYLLLGRYQEAIDQYTLAIDFVIGKLEAAYFNRGLAYEAMNDFDSALKDFNASLAARPGFGPAQQRVDAYREKSSS